MISRLMRALQMDSKLPAQTSLANVIKWKPYMNRKLIHWAALTGKNNHYSNCSPVMMPRRKVAVFSVTYHTRIASAAIFLKTWVTWVVYGWMHYKERIEWSLPEVHRTLYEEVMNHFLKVCDSLSSYLVTSCVHYEFWQQTFAKG